jgi:hypothetical protein
MAVADLKFGCLCLLPVEQGSIMSHPIKNRTQPANDGGLVNPQVAMPGPAEPPDNPPGRANPPPPRPEDQPPIPGRTNEDPFAPIPAPPQSPTPEPGTPPAFDSRTGSSKG